MDPLTLTEPEASALEPRCVVTRLRFPRARDYYAGIRRFRRLRTLANQQSAPPTLVGLLRNRRAKELVFLSVWPSEYELLKFITLKEHVAAARWSFEANAQVWSTLFVFHGLSSRSTAELGPDRRWHPVIADWTRFLRSQ
jgi:hypothetical protein